MLRGMSTTAAVVMTIGLLSAPPAQAAEPAVGQCFAYSKATLDDVSSPAAPVACTARHTAETYAVLQLPDAFGLPAKATAAARLAAAEPCTTKAMNAYLGLTDRRLPSRFETVVRFPTNDQWKQGERWMRCDVVLQGGTALVTLTRPVAEFVAASDPAQFDFCTPGTPRATNTASAPCTKPKSNWIKVLDRDLGKPGSAFPGRRAVEDRTRALCRAQGKQWNGKEKYPGWWAIWPTQVGWRKGQRSAQCFVPYVQYQAELAAAAPAATPATPPPAASPAAG